jgi:hypothetical protein
MSEIAIARLRTLILGLGLFGLWTLASVFLFSC